MTPVFQEDIQALENVFFKFSLVVLFETIGFRWQTILSTTCEKPFSAMFNGKIIFRLFNIFGKLTGLVRSNH